MPLYSWGDGVRQGPGSLVSDYGGNICVVRLLDDIVDELCWHDITWGSLHHGYGAEARCEHVFCYIMTGASGPDYDGVFAFPGGVISERC